MAIGPKVPWTTRLGSIGESEVKTRLQYFSIPTKYELDVGIDFYCELLENDSPSTPFYVQAKGTEHFDPSWGAGIEKSTIGYWLERPFPVFLIVYDENEDRCYWMPVEDQRQSILERLKTSSATIYIRMDRAHVLEKGREANLTFVNKVKDDLISVEMWRGHAQFKGEDYVKTIPDAPRFTIELLRIKENLRMNMYSLVRYYFDTGDLDNAYNCCEFLVRFDRSHYNHFVWFAMVNQLLGRKGPAREYFGKALDICERDKTWPKESMDTLKGAIRKAVDNL